MALAELKEKRSKLLDERKVLNDRALAENRAFTPEERTTLKTKSDEYNELNYTITEIEDGETQAKLLDRAVKAARRSTGEGNLDPDGDLESGIKSEDLRKYSLVRAMDKLADSMTGKGSLDGIEYEMSKEMEKIYGVSSKGLMIPSRVLVGHRPRAAAVDPTTGTGGVSTVTSSDYIDALRNLTVLGKLGLTMLPNLQGKFSIPKVTTALSVYWPGDATAPTAGAVALGSVLFSDKPIACYQDYTRSFTKQTSLAVEQFARDQIIRGIASGLCDAVMNGTGGANTLMGVMNNTNNAVYSMTNSSYASSGPIAANLTGATATWVGVVGMETAVAAGNVMIDSGAYVFPASVTGAMKTNAKITVSSVTTGQFISEGGEINGYPHLTTNSLPIANGTNSSSASGVFANWRDGVIGMWGGLDLTLDPYALSTSGGLRFIGIQNVDFQERNYQSFCRVYGIKP